MSEDGWIVHDEKRMHAPQLAEHCVICLRAELAAVKAHEVSLMASLHQRDGDVELLHAQRCTCAAGVSIPEAQPGAHHALDCPNHRKGE